MSRDHSPRMISACASLPCLIRLSISYFVAPTLTEHFVMSAARKGHVLSASMGYTPSVWRPRRWSTIASSVTGRKAWLVQKPHLILGLPHIYGFH